MRHVVIDTNCLVQMISLHSPYRPIWNAFLEGKFLLCVSNEILEEYQEIIEQQTTFAVNAEYLVSDDKHFEILKRMPFPSLNLVKMSEFLSVIPHL